MQSAQYAIVVLGINDLPAGHQPPALREIMLDLARSAAADCHMTSDDWQAADLDGNLVLQIPSWVPVAQLAGPFTGALDARLARDSQEPAPGALRLHLALHAGPVFLGGPEPAGPAVDLALQLADAPALRDTLAAAPRARMAVITSDAVYQDVLRHAHRLVDAAAYLPVSVGISGGTGWLTVPGYPAPPGISPVQPPRGSTQGADPQDPGSGQAGAVFHANVVHGDQVNHKVVYGDQVGTKITGAAMPGASGAKAPGS